MNGTPAGWRELFAYDRWANARALDALVGSDPWRSGGAQEGPLARAGQLLAHVAIAKEVWLARVEGREPAADTLWPPCPADAGASRLARSAAAWEGWLDRLGAEALEREVGYRNTAGAAFTTRLDRILQHVVNHGTHHRGQVTELLRARDVPRPPLDYVAFTRERAAV